MVSTAFGLGIDFGTSSTVAMLRWPDGRVKPLLFEGSPLLPSAVFAPRQGSLVVGSDALHHGRFEPSQLEPNPKRLIDDESLLLGDREVSVTELFTAVLLHVATEASRVTGGVLPTTALAYPAGWGTVRRGALLDAAQAAGLGEVTLVPEPVAAADYFTRVLNRDVPMGQALVVYDLGAGTFDSSAVRRVESGFEVAAVDGLDDLGGLDIDAAVVGWLRDGPASGRDDHWARLDNPVTADDRRQRRELWDDVRVAKEMLSRAPAVLVRLPALDLEIQLTRDEFEAVAQPLLNRTVRTTSALIRYAKLAPENIAGLLLVGGSSRVPLVATLLHRTVGIAPIATEQPELIVAEGALQSVAVSPAGAATGAAAAAAPGGFPGAPVSGAPTSGTHTYGAPTSGAPTGAPVAGIPVSGAPTSGAPASGAPAYAPQGGFTPGAPTSGAPVSGVPVSGGIPGMPVSGYPVGGQPNSGFHPAAPVSPSGGFAAGTVAGPAPAGSVASPAPVGFAHPVQGAVGHWAAVPTAPQPTVEPHSAGIPAGMTTTGTVYVGGAVPAPPPVATDRPTDLNRDSRVVPVWDIPSGPRPAVAPLPSGGPPVPQQRRSPVRLIVAAVVAVWIVIAAVVVLANLPGRNARTGVPDLAGASQSDATAKLLGSRLKLGDVSFEESTTAAPDTVLRTEPPANRRVREGTRINLVLARAAGRSEETTLPDLARKSRDDATAALTAAGLTPGEVTYEESGDVSEGLVIRTDPAANSTVAAGTTVNLVLAVKPGQKPPATQSCHVPDVAHQPREYAVSQMENARVPYQIKKEDSDSVEPGTVIRTDPGAGRLDPCRKVTLYVSWGVPISVPDVTHRAESYARSTLEEKGFVVNVRWDNYCDGTESKEAVVTSQNPAGGSTGHKGDTVTIRIPKYTGVCASKAAP